MKKAQASIAGMVVMAASSAFAQSPSGAIQRSPFLPPADAPDASRPAAAGAPAWRTNPPEVVRRVAPGAAPAVSPQSLIRPSGVVEVRSAPLVLNGMQVSLSASPLVLTGVEVGVRTAPLLLTGTQANVSTAALKLSGREIEVATGSLRLTGLQVVVMTSPLVLRGAQGGSP